MQLFIFIVGFFVSMMVVYGVFAQVPAEIRPPEDVSNGNSSFETEKN